VHRLFDSLIRSATLAISFAASSKDSKSECEGGVTCNNSHINGIQNNCTLKQQRIFQHPLHRFYEKRMDIPGLCAVLTPSFAFLVSVSSQ
jgi:hypothetical protein